MIIVWLIRLVLIGLLIFLICSLISQHRDFRKLKEYYRNTYGREYNDDPSQIKEAFIKFYGYFCRFFRLSGKFDK